MQLKREKKNVESTDCSFNPQRSALQLNFRLHRYSDLQRALISMSLSWCDQSHYRLFVCRVKLQPWPTTPSETGGSEKSNLGQQRGGDVTADIMTTWSGCPDHLLQQRPTLIIYERDHLVPVQAGMLGMTRTLVSSSKNQIETSRLTDIWKKQIIKILEASSTVGQSMNWDLQQGAV